MRTLLALALVAAPAFADGNSDKTSATTKVNIYAPITIVKGADLDFGAIVMSGFTGGSVELSDATPAVYTDCAKLGGTAARNPTLAWFHVRKDATLAYSREATVHTVADCTFDPVVFGAATPCVLAGTVDGKDFSNKVGTNKEHFYVGGKLTIPADTFGEKTGTLEVTVAYN